jgi:hypothetical protein
MLHELPELSVDFTPNDFIEAAIRLIKDHLDALWKVYPVSGLPIVILKL